MPGLNKEAMTGSAMLINMLDTGAPNNFTGDKNSRAYGTIIAAQKWQQLEVKNADFMTTKPCSGIQVNSNQMIIFGGEQKAMYTFDTREVS